MKDEEILNGNRLIAEFMGGQFFTLPETVSKFWVRLPNNKHKNRITELRYHSSWDWLMPVVEKIEKVKIQSNTFKDWPYVEVPTVSISTYDTFISVGDNMITFTSQGIYKMGALSECLPRMQHCFKAIIAFIIWYNENNKK